MAQSRFCGNCGAQNISSASVCHNCGKHFGQTQIGSPHSNPNSAQQALSQGYGAAINQQNAAAPQPLQAAATQRAAPTIRVLQLSLEVLQMPDGTSRDIVGTQFIGREASKCQIVLSSQGVSRCHAKIEAIGPGHVTLTDLGSSSGTYVNHALLPPNQPMRLQPNALIQLGDAQLRYQTQAPYGQVAVMSLAPLDKSDADAVGVVSAVNSSTTKLPLSIGRVLTFLSIIVVVVWVIGIGGITAVALSIPAILLGCCAVVPLLLGFFAVLIKGWSKLVMRNDQMTQIGFQVMDVLSRNVTSVVVFVERGGSATISEGDEVRVFGKLNQNNVMMAKKVEIHRHNGIELNPVSRVKGNGPTSVTTGLFWFGLSLLPLVYLMYLLYSKGFFAWITTSLSP